MRPGLVLSLFPGIGLLDMAFEEQGFCVVRGPDVLWGGDVKRFHPPTGVFDGVVGGPPCQAFSALANLVRARGYEPRFGNLIPEFERVVAEAEPWWFLMENVPAAPVPEVGGFAVHDFMLCNSWIEGEDGFGQEQERRRRFSFGVRGVLAPDLRRWITQAALLLPAVPAVLADARDTPVALGGSGKPKRTAAVFGDGRETRDRPKMRHSTVVANAVEAHSSPGGDGPARAEYLRTRQAAVTGAHQCSHRPKGGRGERRSLAEMCRLQGLPEDFLELAPFTADAKRKAVANGVPLPMGRAIAKAVVAALGYLAVAPVGEVSG